MAAAGFTSAAGTTANRSTMGLTPDSFQLARPARAALEFLDFAQQIGAGGVQATLPSLEPDYLRKVRQRLEQTGMYLDVLTPMPGEDTAPFERLVEASREAGANSIRTVCLSGRRYETFSTLEEWKKFVQESRAKLRRVAPIAERRRFPIGVENHKDFTVEEMVPLMKEFGNEFLGVCLDWGNNISLLDDPLETAEALAPFVVNSHIKDMAAEECDDGFLLAEVPMGDGMLPLKKILAVLVEKRPRLNFSLDMITRNPLRIPCLTPKYWATFPERNGRHLARMLGAVRANKPPQRLPRLDGLARADALRWERENVQKCLAFARDRLGLRPPGA